MESKDHLSIGPKRMKRDYEIKRPSHNKSLNQTSFLFLTIPVTNSVNRRDLGHSFDLGVDRSNHNLVVSGPPAPYAGFPGTSTYYQRSYGHVTPFLAFGGYKPQYPWKLRHDNFFKLMTTCDLDARVMLICSVNVLFLKNSIIYRAAGLLY